MSNYEHKVPLLLLIYFIAKIQGLNCPLPDAEVNTKVTTSGLEPGQVATYSCDTGYELFGKSTRTCGENGVWSGNSPLCVTNVAWRKPANQSSTARGGPAYNANDGDKTTVHDDNKCTQTQKEDAPWWSVDLLQEYEILYIRITSRGCCDQDEIQDLEVRIGDSPNLQGNRLCTWFPDKIEKGATQDLKCARAMMGRYVFIKMGVPGSLSLCEVEVFSKHDISKDRCKGDFDLKRLGLFNRTCYEFQVTSGGTFEAARSYCQKRRRGDLVHGFESTTLNFLISELERVDNEVSIQTKMVWVGAQKEPLFTSRIWWWIDGREVTSPPWGKEQPNNFNKQQNCVVLDGTRGWLWNDVGCNLNHLHWLCQFQPSCGTPDRRSNTTLTIQPLENDDSFAVYSCPVGSKIVGEKTRNCSADGYWTGLAPSCQYINCGKPSKIDNGVVSLMDDRTTYEARAQYLCAENYTMDGNDTVVCGDRGEWEPRIPHCLYSWCTELESPLNGFVSLSGRRSGDTATFTCDPGYYIVGPEHLSCLLGGTWSGTPPSCRFVECGLPDTLDHGKMILVNSTIYLGSMALYQCEDDYWLNGPELRICSSNGLWSGENPFCEKISCGQPEIPVGGTVTGYSLEVHSEINYHCEPGHYLTGESVRVCTEEGRWSGVPPNCTFVNCGHVPAIIKGEVLYEDEDAPTFLDSRVHYKCMPNYRLIGNDIRVCLKSGKWSSDSPKCEEIRCKEPEHPEKSRVTVTGNDRRISLVITRSRHDMHSNTTYKVGSQLTYRCLRGFVIDGIPTRTCLNNGSWTGVIPTCKYVDCGTPPSVDRGIFRLLSNETSYGSVVSYECEENWKIDGKVRRHCLENGTWSGDFPKCVEVLCPSISEELEKRYEEEDEREIEPWNKALIERKEKDRKLRIDIDDGDRRVGSFATYKCREGQKVVGEATRNCKQHGVWDGLEPKCEWVYCEKPQDIENGRIHALNEEYIFGSVVEYFCLPKFYLHGSFNRTCTASGKWSGRDPICSLDDRDIGGFDYNSISESSNLAGHPLDESVAGASYTGIYVGVAVSLLLVIGVALALLYFKAREKKMAKSSSSNGHSPPPSSTSKPIETPYPTVMTYGDLNDPTTGNNIYEHIPDDYETSSYANMSPTSSFNSTPPNSYSNLPIHTYSNIGRELPYPYTHSSSQFNGKPSSDRSSVSRRPRMPPPQPPTVTPSSVGVTVNGVAVNSST